MVPENESVPEDLFGLDMQYQHPFSTILFSKNVLQDYEDFLSNLKKQKKYIDKESLRIFATAQYSNFKNEYSKIHKYLASVFINAYKEDFLRMIKGNGMFVDDTITEDIYINYVTNYIVDVLFEYTNHNTNTLNHKLSNTTSYNTVYIGKTLRPSTVQHVVDVCIIKSYSTP